MFKRKRIEGLSWNRLIIAIIMIFMLTVISRQNALVGGVATILAIGGFVWLKYRRNDYVKAIASQEELYEEFEDDEKTFAEYVAKVFSTKGYIWQLAPRDMKSSVDIKLWKEGRESLVKVIVADVGEEIDAVAVRNLHLDMVECDSDEGFLVTTGSFEPELAREAEKYKITLIDGESLIQMNSR